MTLVLIGGGGHAGAVAEVARSAGFTILGALTPAGSPVAPGLVRLGDDNWIEQALSDVAFHLALGPKPRRNHRALFFERLVQRGADLPTIIASTAIVSPTATLSTGSVAMHATVINTTATIGRNCIINTRAVVEHDCSVGDHTHVAPGALICGGVQIGQRCLIGTGAVILPGVSIADGVVIGAGAVVVRSISEPNETWSGNPARRHR